MKLWLHLHFRKSGKNSQYVSNTAKTQSLKLKPGMQSRHQSLNPPWIFQLSSWKQGSPITVNTAMEGRTTNTLNELMEGSTTNILSITRLQRRKETSTPKNRLSGHPSQLPSPKTQIFNGENILGWVRSHTRCHFVSIHLRQRQRLSSTVTMTTAPS